VSTDSELIRRSRASPSEFGELYERHATTIHRYAASRAGVSIADDVMSETFLVAFQSRGAFDHAHDSAAPWLLGIATNLLRRHHRAQARLLKTIEKAGAPEQVPDAAADVISRLDAAASVGSIAHAVRKLPAIDRDTLLLFAWADLSYEEIAVAMAVPIGTVRSRLNRARRVLRKATDTDEDEDYGRADAAARPA
jgi:RNA polymerase sigma-70 factor (ECF subfamily)